MLQHVIKNSLHGVMDIETVYDEKDLSHVHRFPL